MLTGWTDVIIDNVLHFAAFRGECSSSYECACKCIVEQRHVKYKETRWRLLQLATAVNSF